MPDQLAELVPAPLGVPVPSRGADVASTWDAQGSHSSLPRYKLCFAMCWTTPSGTRYHTGRPAFTRLRQSVEEIAIAGISTSETPLFGDRKSTRLNSSHVAISYAVFCLKKKKND